MPMLQVIAILIEDKPGALARVTGVVTAQGYNIASLTVARTTELGLSRMTVVLEVERPSARVVNRINRLVNVIDAVDLTDARSVQRELILMRTPTSNRAAIRKEAEWLGARVISSSPNELTLEATGDPQTVDDSIEALRALGNVEIVRSGVVALVGRTKSG